jgi:anti-anti-sigma factor
MGRLFVVEGNMDSPAIGRTVSDYESLARSNQDLTIDMRQVEHIDGAGIGALVHVLKRVRAKGFRLQLTNVSGQPLSLLARLGVLELLEAELPSGDLSAQRGARAGSWNWIWPLGAGFGSALANRLEPVRVRGRAEPSDAPESR